MSQEPRRPLYSRVLEDTDADGNRGRYVCYARCWYCGYELDNMNDVCDNCSHPIDWSDRGDEDDE